MDDYEQRIIDDISEHGWFCVSVFDGKESPDFSYSVGFWETLESPELVVYGLPLKLMHSMLWSAFRQIQSRKLKIGDGVRWSGLIEGFDCISRPVHRSQICRDTLNSALWYRRHRKGSDHDLSAYQLFWPGKLDGLFPWESGCSDIVRESQPLLYLPRETGVA